MSWFRENPSGSPAGHLGGGGRGGRGEDPICAQTPFQPAGAGAARALPSPELLAHLSPAAEHSGHLQALERPQQGCTAPTSSCQTAVLWPPCSCLGSRACLDQVSFLLWMRLLSVWLTLTEVWMFKNKANICFVLLRFKPLQLAPVCTKVTGSQCF